ncbi:hypothetical protein Hypma_013266 [Hypsizygus marmoreus]|uniref:Uncharacterized protein n=1 Tax=Hypsizygus marmoreus TaxID=39966 RepID=A0A369JEN1_HYPMA|nr:hypothetical protein Hypma_013266 [Hypsizygus marmoreus]
MSLAITSSIWDHRTRDRYHHFIPRFILRRYQSNPELSKGPKEAILCYGLQDRTLRTCLIARVYGVHNLYRDLRLPDVDELERLLADLEYHASRILVSIHNRPPGSQRTIEIIRDELDILKKFLFVMYFRRDKLYRSDVRENHLQSRAVHDWMACFRTHYGLQSPLEVWMFALRYYILVPHFKICLEASELHRKFEKGELYSMMMGLRKMPPEVHHCLSVAYAQQDTDYFIGFWEAPVGTEFVLSSNSFGVWEGFLEAGPVLHRMFVVSPRFAIVLRHKTMLPEKLVTTSPIVRSAFSDIPLHPAHVQYVNAKERFAPHIQHELDRFTFQVTMLSESQMHVFNAVILEHAGVESDSSITFLSESYMLQTVRAYCSLKTDSIWNILDRPKYEPLIEQLLCSIQSSLLPVAVPNAPLWIPDDTTAASDVEGLIHNITQKKQVFQSGYDRSLALLRCIKQSWDAPPPFALEYRQLFEKIVQRCLHQSELHRYRSAPTTLCASLPNPLSERLFAALRSFVRSLGVHIPSANNLKFQLLSEVVLVGFLQWASSDAQLLSSLRRRNPALASAVSAATI